MERERTQKGLAIAMIAVGLLQVVLGVLNDNLLFSVFGVLYGLIGVGWILFYW